MYVKVLMIMLVALMVMCSCNTVTDTKETDIPQLSQPTAPTPTLSPLPPQGTAQPIPNEIKEKMRGISMPNGATTSFDSLSYLTLPYYDFSYNTKEGHMVVAREIEQDVIIIFEELYKIKYPIESMELIDYFNDKQTKELDSLDRASMGNNNTSAFCYRTVSGTGNLSRHALGLAIDINPKINPYITGTTVSPRNAVKYANRSAEGLSEVEKRAMIHSGDEVYRIFAEHGFEWGGEIWTGIYDYQHFQKKK